MRTIHIIGNVNIDLIMGSVADWPRWGTEAILPHSECRAGGAAGNTALALAARGVPHRLAGTAGTDALAAVLAEAFPESFPSWPRHTGQTTLSVGVVRDDGERTFLTTIGHLGAYALEDVTKQLEGRVHPGDVALVCGTFLTDRLTARYDDLFAWLAERGAAVAFDPGWPNAGWSAVRHRVEGWLPRCQHLLLNDIETLSLAGAESLDEAAPLLARHLLRGATLVVKRGGHGASAWVDGARTDVSAPLVTVVDTIGAGDVFNAGYLEGRMKGLDLAACLSLGVSIASTAVSTAPRRYGPASGQAA